MRRRGVCANNIQKITVDTFHEAVSLKTNSPKTTEEGQHRTSFSVAVALAWGHVIAFGVSEQAFQDQEILRLSIYPITWENNHPNKVFPTQRLAKVTITLEDDQVCVRDWVEPKWDTTDPPSALELKNNEHSLAYPILGEKRAQYLANAIDGLTEGKDFVLLDLLFGDVG